MVNRVGRTNVANKKGGGKKSGFTYKARDPSAMKKRAEQQGGRFDSFFKSGVDTYRPKVGDNQIRILPPTWPDHEHFGYDLWVHRFIGADESTYLCPRKMLNEHCPICIASKEAKDSGEADEAKHLAAAKLVAVWIINRDEESTTPVVYAMSWTMDRDIASLCFNKRSGKTLMIDHPDEGYDFMFKRSGQGIKTRYNGLQLDREASPIFDDQDQQDEVLNYIEENPIPDTLHFYDADYLEAVINGTAAKPDEDLEEEEAEERPARRAAKPSGKPASRRPAREEPEEEEEQEEEERPTRSSRNSSAKRGREEPEEEEPEEEEPEEEEVEERPRRTSGKPGKPVARRPSREEPEEEEEEPEEEEPEEEEQEEAEYEEEQEDEEERPRRSAKPVARRPAKPSGRPSRR